MRLLSSFHCHMYSTKPAPLSRQVWENSTNKALPHERHKLLPHPDEFPLALHGEVVLGAGTQCLLDAHGGHDVAFAPHLHHHVVDDGQGQGQAQKEAAALSRLGAMSILPLRWVIACFTTSSPTPRPEISVTAEAVQKPGLKMR